MYNDLLDSCFSSFGNLGEAETLGDRIRARNDG